MCHGTLMNEPFHAYEWVMSHVYIESSHVARICRVSAFKFIYIYICMVDGTRQPAANGTRMIAMRSKTKEHRIDRKLLRLVTNNQTQAFAMSTCVCAHVD